MTDLIDAWTHRGEATPWEAVVGHERQVRRCRELVEKLRRSEAHLERLGIRLGRGLVIAGPPGVGKTLLARALASAIGRPVIVPPTPELTPELIGRLYARLARIEPAVVILDEAETLIGQDWLVGVDPAAVRALCTALDGIERPRHGPVTIALTTARAHEVSPTVSRPGRLAPRLELDLPTDADRRLLLERAVDRLPRTGELDLETIVTRTAGWSGAELAIAVEESMSRSLLDGGDALSQDTLLEVVAERYVVADDALVPRGDPWHIARHEAGHAIAAALEFGPEMVRVVEVLPHGRQYLGRTELDASLLGEPRSVNHLRKLAAIMLAGQAGDLLLGGHAVAGGGSDRTEATRYLIEIVELGLPYDLDLLETGQLSDRGSERLRAAFHAAVEEAAHDALRRATAMLAPVTWSINALADAIMEAPSLTLSGPELAAAIRKATGETDVEAPGFAV